MYYLKACQVTLELCNLGEDLQDQGGRPKQLGTRIAEDRVLNEDEFIKRMLSCLLKSTMDITTMHDQYGHKGEGLLGRRHLIWR
jgi:hypothetical protein